MIRSKLAVKLKNRLGKVYIEPSMKNYALPISETLRRMVWGFAKRIKNSDSRGEKLRAFTYWEQVNDIDLSVFALQEDGRQMEFSWRTMAKQQSGAITYSGDETSGYYGCSEYLMLTFRLKHCIQIIDI